MIRIALTLGLVASLAPASGAQTLTITNITVVDVTNGHLSPHMNVAVDSTKPSNVIQSHFERIDLLERIRTLRDWSTAEAVTVGLLQEVLGEVGSLRRDVASSHHVIGVALSPADLSDYYNTNLEGTAFIVEELINQPALKLERVESRAVYEFKPGWLRIRFSIDGDTVFSDSHVPGQLGSVVTGVVTNRSILAHFHER